MTTLPEEAVKAALCAWLHEEEYAYILEAWLEDEDRQNDMRAALTAALPFLPVQGVKVKALEWGKSSVSEQDKAQTVVGLYFISNHTVDAHNLMFDNDQITALLSVHTSLEDAKAAAQADYEARILSALEPSAARELALEEAARVADYGNAAWLKKRDATVNKKEARDYETMAIACSHVAAAIRTLSSPGHADAGKVEGDGWQPIESAPKDGTTFIVVNTGEIERWHTTQEGVVITVPANDRPTTCAFYAEGLTFIDEFGEVYTADGVVIDAEDLTAADNVLRLTHWQPMPALPSAPASEGAE